MADEDRRRTVSASAPRTPGTLHSTTVSSPRALSDGASSYFDHPASAFVNHGVHEGEYASTHQHGRSGRASPSECASALDDEGSDEDNSSTSTDADRNLGRSFSKWPFLKLPELSTTHRNILKCCIAYFLASLFTFSPYLSGFIADITGDNPGERTPSPSGHMVATVAVYFNPAKTLGGMVEADVFCTMGLVFASFVSLSSMSVYWFFERQGGLDWLADVLVLLMIGVGMSVVAWMKVWMAKPSFNTACSMTAIILFVVVVKEGGLDTLLQVSFIVFVGALVTNVVCLLIWPQRATKNLQNNMTQTLDSFSTLLSLLTQTFLLEEPRGFSSDRIQRAVTNHQASFTSLKKSLIEAQSERLFGGPGKSGEGAQLGGSSGQAYEDAIDSLNRLGQHLNGLRSGITLQQELIRGHREGKVILRNSSINQKPVENRNGKGKGVGHDQNSSSMDNEEIALLQSAATIFGDLLDDLGPPLKALSTHCVSTFKRLREAFVQSRDVQSAMRPADFAELSDNIERALFAFESTSNHAVLRMYRSGQAVALEHSRSSIASFPSENQLLMGDESETIFLVYFFIFTLQEYARELISLVDAMSRICSIERASAARGGVWRRIKARFGPSLRRQGDRTGQAKRISMKKRFSSYFVPQRPHKAVSFPKVTPHAPNTIQTPAREYLTLMGRVKQSIWALGARLQQQDMKYAFKVGMATAILAAPAFFQETRPLFVEYRGEWALISFFVVISPTIGATNYMGVFRVLGTLLGATTAYLAWSAFPEDPYILSIFGLFYSVPCFYYIVAKPQYATSVRCVLLTYNLTCLYCYNIRQTDVAVFDIAYERAISVILGVVWAAIVSRYWWPAEARRELSRALGEFCLNVGWLYTRLVAFNSFSDEEFHLHIMREDEESPTEESHLLHTNPALSQSIQDFMAMELHLQIKLIELQGLLSQTQHEPRLKGPFPVALYRSILTSLQAILDRLHSMRCVTSREEWYASLGHFTIIFHTVRRDFIIPVNKERREMVGNVILYFSTLAAAFRLKSPLPPYLPPAESARERLVQAIRKLDVVRNRDVKGSRHLLFFAYAVTMKGVIQELDYLGRTLQDAFGVIGESREAFERLFEAPPPEPFVTNPV
ncbi:Fusaric acid resistance protein-like-domain-containing protein [Dichomitus squalens]|uniref:Fusaric acid resistance protein-like-domain-containing protein n=1 Tax=Dichomitus squalens TaxID=114155 RepID=A0A4Q9P669_9APHY|nr:Fusaric acid resistance protein-like-domain-containing protein [Dichomitus squalens]TBU48667.1 Fusaric acid resistance protein-like-domain-containing protein [Dichomitus squalens]